EDAPGNRTVAVAEPADARRQALEVHPLLGEAEPAHEVLVVLERLHERSIRRVDVLGITGERDPAERPLSLAEEGTDEGGNEAGIREVVHARVLRLEPDVVAAVEEDAAGSLQLEHRPHGPAHRPRVARERARRIARARA